MKKIRNKSNFIMKGKFPAMMVNGHQYSSRNNNANNRTLMDVHVSWKAYNYYAKEICLIIYKLHPVEDLREFCMKGFFYFERDSLEGVGNLELDELKSFCENVGHSNFMCNLFKVVPFTRYFNNADREILKAELLNATKSDPKFMIELLSMDGRSMESIKDELNSYVRTAEEMMEKAKDGMKESMED